MSKLLKFSYLLTINFVLLLGIKGNLYAQLSLSDSTKLNTYIQNAKEASANDDAVKAAHFYNKAGLFCLENNLYSEAILYFTNSAKFNSELKNTKELKKIYSNLGLMYFSIKELDRSLFYFNKSLNVRKLIGKEVDIASGLIDIGFVYGVKEDYAQAISSVKKALIIAQSINHSKLIMICYRMLAENYKAKKEIKKAEEYYQKYSTFNVNYQKTRLQQKEEAEDIKSIAQLNIEKAQKRANLLEFELQKKQSKALEDSIKREKEKIEDSLKYSQISLSRQSDSITYLNQQTELKNIKYEQEKARRLNQRLYLYLGLGALIFILLIAFLLYTRMRSARKQKKNIEYKNNILQSAFTKLEENNKEIAKQKQDIEAKNIKLTEAFDKIEEQNINIESSISYARNIQKALLPQQEDLNKHFKESFILFLPRDKVSGDFFWFKEAKYRNEQNQEKTKVLISAIDCTGHGVPGALLSMIGYNSLENISSVKKIIRPNLILHELHSEVRQILRQDTTDNKDGMDLAVCAYDPDNNILEFSGAKNPLVYIKNNEIFHIKGGSKPIAGGKFYEELMKDFRYENHIVKITEPTTFYIFSDGFPDQIGGNNKRKYLIRRFKDLLLEIHSNPMKDQAELLNLILEQWRGEEKQIDDIIVIGFRLSPK